MAHWRRAATISTSSRMIRCSILSTGSASVLKASSLLTKIIYLRSKIALDLSPQWP